MSDPKKITQLPAASAANLTDLLAKVNDPSGTPQTQKLTIQQLQTLMGKTWDNEIVKPADQTVTNNATPQNDSALFVAIQASKLYEFEFILLYAGNNTTGDYRCRFTYPNITGAGICGFYTAWSSTLTSQFAGAVGGLTQWPPADLILGTDPTVLALPVYMRFVLFTPTTPGTLQFQFANSSAASGRDSVTKKDSVLRWNLLST